MTKRSIIFAILLLIIVLVISTIATFSPFNFEKIATPISVPESYQPFRLIETNDPDTFFVLTTNGVIFLYSTNGELLDTYSGSATAPISIALLWRDPKRDTVTYTARYTGVNVIVRSVELAVANKHIVEQNSKILHKLESRHNENTFHPEITLVNHCLSIDIENGSCYYTYLTITTPHIKASVPGKTMISSLGLEDKTYVILSDDKNPSLSKIKSATLYSLSLD